MRLAFATQCVFPVALVALRLQAAEPVRMEKIQVQDKECLRLSNGRIDLVVPTQSGPRILRVGFVDGPNFLAPAGHRLWRAPEDKRTTYVSDNQPVESRWDGQTLFLQAPMDGATRISKAMEITMDPQAARVKVLHRLSNHNAEEVELAPWGLSVVSTPAYAVFPQEPFRSHPKALLPARPLVLWHYTDMSDPRWKWGKQFIQLRPDANAKTPQKFGLRNSPGWFACVQKKQVLLKTFGLEAKATYPDFGCNTEAYTQADFLELETLGPLVRVPPGGAATHLETWHLFQTALGETETELSSGLDPLLKECGKKD